MSGLTTKVKADTVGKETAYTFNHLYFSTSYSFVVKTRFYKGDQLGRGVTIVKMTGPFSASVGPLQKTIQDNTVILSWSAPRTINLNRGLKVNTVHVAFFLALRRKCNFYVLTCTVS